jgi:hypothetical protein
VKKNKKFLELVFQIDGVLPSKKKTEEAAMKVGSQEFSLDPDTLAQVLFLQEIMISGPS